MFDTFDSACAYGTTKGAVMSRRRRRKERGTPVGAALAAVMAFAAATAPTVAEDEQTLPDEPPTIAAPPDETWIPPDESDTAQPPAASGETQTLLDESAAALRAFVADDKAWPEIMPWFHAARAVVLAPSVFEAGFFFGAAGGRCVVVARGGDEGWSAPSFCTLGEASVGLQIGFQKSALLMLVMTDRAVEALTAGTAKFGGDAGLAVGTFGYGVKGAAMLSFGAEILAVARSRGVYGGLAFDGGWIAPDDPVNQAYYSRAVTARHILIDGRVDAPGAALFGALDEADQTGRGDGEAN